MPAVGYASAQGGGGAPGARQVLPVRTEGDAEHRLRVPCAAEGQQARRVAADYLATGAPLHVLVNNAGQLVHPRGVGPDGLELNFATNTLAPFILTQMLLPALRKGAPSRVVTVASGGAYTEPLEIDDLQWERGGFSGTKQYARDKRRQLACTEWWAAQPANAGVLFLAMHPGWADTEAVRTSLPQFYESLQPRLRTPEEGADTVVWLSVVDAAKAKLANGAFYFDRAVAEKHLPLSWTEYPPERAAELVRKLAAVGGVDVAA